MTSLPGVIYDALTSTPIY